MNFLQLCQAVVREAGLSGNGPATVVNQTGMLGRIVAWVADAWADIQRERTDWRFLWRVSNAALVIGKQLYTYADLGAADAARISAIYLIRDGQRHRLDGCLCDERVAILNRTNTGMPAAFVELPDRTVLFDALPDAAMSVEVEYYRKPQVLAANGDVPLVAEQYHRAIVQRALIAYAAFDEAQTLLQMAGARYEREYGQMVNDLTPQIGMGSSPYP
ncbi:MAG: hypothetical protein II007_13385 [Gammaproteobacteria bacterium]|nr:hypothetical protein [Gammaproteobacteria bacterium]